MNAELKTTQVLSAPRAVADHDAAQAWPWFAGRAWGTFLAAAYPLLVCTPLFVLTYLEPQSRRPLVAEVGADCSILGFTILCFQFVIAARLRWIEAPFGFDVLLGFHRAMALLGAAMLCLHPVLVSSAEGWSLITRLHARWYIWAGRLTLATLLVHLAISCWRRRLYLSYEWWRRLHAAFAISIVALGFAHGLLMSGGRVGATVVWSALVATATATWLYSRAIRPRLQRRQPFSVLAVKMETPRVWTVVLKPPASRTLRFAPGQFLCLRFRSAGLSGQEHPFSIASSPVQSGQVRLTIKECGDFTAGIGRIRPGDTATVHGPFGRFSHTLHPDEADLVFVAGGVGITPLMSMLRWMRDREETRRVLLVYANRRLSDVVFAPELAAMETAASPRLKVIHVLSNARPEWSGEVGRLDAGRLARLSGGVEGKAFYLCCPGPMTSTLVQGLRQLGVGPHRIHTDCFSF